jgi:hypothetical protein
MSHFTVLVVTSEKANDENVGYQLAPFHEFECTGSDDEFIQDIDRTEELRSEYEEKPRQKSLLTFSQDYYGYSIVPENDVQDFVGLNKYGYITVNKDNEVIKVVQRTNPNKKWDWWAVGGRWSGMLQPKLGHNYPCERGRPGVMGSLYDERGFDSVRKDEVDWDGMIKQTSDNRNKLINEALDELSGKTHRTHEEIKAIFKAASENWKQVEAEWEAQRTSNPNTIRLYDYIKKLPAEHPVSIAIKTNIWGHFINMVGVPETAGDPLVWANTPSPFSCFGFLRDRKWSQRGEMHCFACVANEMDEADWDKQFTALIAEVPDDHWLTVVDCHI